MRTALLFILIMSIAAPAFALRAIPEPSSPEVAKKQEWIMDNCPIGAKWDIVLFTKQLGASEKVPVTTREARVFEAHYFPAAEMTLLRNKLKDSVATYGWGKTGDL